jgi:hypothetical protein
MLKFLAWFFTRLYIDFKYGFASDADAERRRDLMEDLFVTLFDEKTLQERLRKELEDETWLNEFNQADPEWVDEDFDGDEEDTEDWHPFGDVVHLESEDDDDEND